MTNSIVFSFVHIPFLCGMVKPPLEKSMENSDFLFPEKNGKGFMIRGQLKTDSFRTVDCLLSRRTDDLKYIQ